MQLTLSRSESNAVYDLRGVPQGAHLLLMTGRPVGMETLLDGPNEWFDELVGHMYEELEEGLVSPARSRTLARLLERIEKGLEGAERE